MSADEILEAVFVINPRTGERARRLACAIGLLREGRSTREASVILRERFSISRMEAWRVVDIANDLAGAATEGNTK